MPSLMPSSSQQPPPLLLSSSSLQSPTSPSPPSYSLPTPLSEVELPSSLQPPPSLMQGSSLQSPSLPSASLQPPLWMMLPSWLMPPSSSSYSLSTPFSAVENKMMNNSKKNEERNFMPCKRKERIVWTEELHQKFVRAVEQLGGSHKAVPKRILEIMNNSELNPSHISSHLQKYRKCLEGIKGAPKTDLEEIGSPYVVHDQYPVMNDIDMYMKPSEINYYAAAVEQRANCHQLLHPNPYMESNMLSSSPFSQQPLSSLQSPPLLMPWLSLQSPPLLQPQPLPVPPALLSSPPSYSLSCNPLSAVEESDMLTPSSFSLQPSSSLQPSTSPMQRSSLQSPPLLQASPLVVPSASLQPPPLMTPSSSQSPPPSYSHSTSLLAVEDTNEKGNSMPRKRKERVIWTEELHQKFVWAVEQLGGPDNAVPKRILQIMNNSELNPKHISSHLRKYRKRLEGIEGASKATTQEIESPSVVHEQYPVMDDINMYMMPSEMNYSVAALEQRANSHQQLHPNPSMMSDEPLELLWEDSLLNYDDIFSDF